MFNYIFVSTLTAMMAYLLYWGFRNLPAERWQMMAAVPKRKTDDGHWQGLNLTFYGFFSATGTVFGIAVGILLISALGVPLVVTMLFVAALLALCLPASRLVAAIVEGKRNTFTVAGAGFVAIILLPPLIFLADTLLRSRTNISLPILPLMAAGMIAYALAEAIGRLACISFGCCYGMPLRNAPSWLARLFRDFHLVFHGSTKKAAYASGLGEEPLVPVQAITSVIFATAGLAGLAFFLSEQWRAAFLIPALGTWGWRALAENLRADHRGNSKISAYQIMSIVAIAYLLAAALLLPSEGALPNLALAFSRAVTLPVLLSLQALWIALFLYYGRSRVTGSTVSFHVRKEAI